ncbi:UNVERIFIED_CONTAM: Retrovirus-related Pol polyprotein from transposon RE1 [Sesamum latifolium]|uniref:Retrovirus-related Pol polyprotein from transposon RE1 n=1 Tax=Sesamum latifolium TaxID=2727402 RepID=A0AAW2TM47_9LAMI
MNDRNDTNQVMQFLMGLNSVYDHMRHQILATEPLPHITKVFAMIVQMEKQMQVETKVGDTAAAFQVQSGEIQKQYKKKPYIGKKSLYCNNCQRTGHSKDTCSRIHGVPDRYKELKDKKKKEINKGKAINAAAVQEDAMISFGDAKLSELMRSEIRSLLKEEKEPMDHMGVNFAHHFEEYAVAKAVTVCLFLCIAAARSWPLHQLDINNAFLHGHLDEEVFMLSPDDYVAPAGHVSRLKRSLYGLKQASRQWNHEFTTKLEAFGFRQSAHDHRLFLKDSDQGFLALLVYVDDVLLTGPSEPLIHDVKQYLDHIFTIKDLGYAKYFLGLEIARSMDGTCVTQHKYITEIISAWFVCSQECFSCPLPPGIKLSVNEDAPLKDPAQ